MLERFAGVGEEGIDEARKGSGTLGIAQGKLGKALRSLDCSRVKSEVNCACVNV